MEKSILKVFLTNLGKYNEGYLIGEWLELPCVEEEIEECLERIGVSDEPDENGRYYEEWFITDYESDCGIKVNEYDSIYDLNSLAERIEDCEDMDAFSILAENLDAEEALEIVESGDYTCYYGANDMEDVAMECVDCGGYGLDNMTLFGTAIINFLDWEAIGNCLETSGCFYKGDAGIVETY